MSSKCTSSWLLKAVTVIRKLDSISIASHKEPAISYVPNKSQPEATRHAVELCGSGKMQCFYLVVCPGFLVILSFLSSSVLVSALAASVAESPFPGLQKSIPHNDTKRNIFLETRILRWDLRCLSWQQE